MARLEIRPFSDEFLAPAAELLAVRHRAHRAAEPLLPERYEDPAATAGEIATLAGSEGASGAVALRDGRFVGYLLGVRKSDEIWGGQQHAYGIQAVPEGRWPEGVRLATEADVDALLDLDPHLSDHQTPVAGICTRLAEGEPGGAAHGDPRRPQEGGDR